MTIDQITSLSPGTTLYQAGGSYVRTYRYGGTVPGCPGHYWLQVISHGVITPRVVVLDTFQMADATTDYGAALHEVSENLLQAQAENEQELNKLTTTP